MFQVRIDVKAFGSQVVTTMWVDAVSHQTREKLRKKLFTR